MDYRPLQQMFTIAIMKKSSRQSLKTELHTHAHAVNFSSQLWFEKWGFSLFTYKKDFLCNECFIFLPDFSDNKSCKPRVSLDNPLGYKNTKKSLYSMNNSLPPTDTRICLIFQKHINLKSFLLIYFVLNTHIINSK